MDPEKRRRVMQSIRKTDTRPEVLVRSVLHALGFRFRLHRRDLPGVPDIVLPRHRVAIQVHGCFWHRHSCPWGAKQPRSNTAYWLPKLKRNRERDERNAASLASLGWRLIVIWECEVPSREAAAAVIKERLEGLLAPGFPALG